MRRKLMQVMMERDHQFRLIKTALRGTCHALRPKYTQRFLSEFEYRFIRRFDLPDINPILANVALRTPPMPQRLLELNLARVVLRGRKLPGVANSSFPAPGANPALAFPDIQMEPSLAVVVFSGRGDAPD